MDKIVATMIINNPNMLTINQSDIFTVTFILFDISSINLLLTIWLTIELVINENKNAGIETINISTICCFIISSLLIPIESKTPIS